MRENISKHVTGLFATDAGRDFARSLNTAATKKYEELREEYALLMRDKERERVQKRKEEKEAKAAAKKNKNNAAKNFFDDSSDDEEE